MQYFQIQTLFIRIPLWRGQEEDKTTTMKNLIIKITISITLLFSTTSCKGDFSQLIQKIETTQVELRQQDSILTTQRAELSALLFIDTTKQKTINSNDSLLTTLVGKQNTLITRLEIIIQKNKELIIKLNNNSANPNEVFKEYTAHVDELELMKQEINSAKDDYNKLVGTMKVK